VQPNGGSLGTRGAECLQYTLHPPVARKRRSGLFLFFSFQFLESPSVMPL